MILKPGPSPRDDADAELAQLFSTMRDDAAPVDLEHRLLQSVAVAGAVGAGTLVLKATLWQKVTLFFATHGLFKSVLVGALSGGLFCSAVTLVQGVGTGVGPVAGATSVQTPVGFAGPKPHSQSQTQAVPGVSAPGSSKPNGSSLEEPPTPSPRGLGSQVSTGISPSGGGASLSAGGSNGAVALAPLPPPEPLPPPPGAPSPPIAPSDDVLQRELALVRTLSALVDAGRCADAKAVIFEYRRAHPNGQLAREVDVLTSRCQLP